GDWFGSRQSLTGVQESRSEHVVPNGLSPRLEQERTMARTVALESSHEAESLGIERDEPFVVEFAEGYLEEAVAMCVGSYTAMRQTNELADAHPGVAHEQQA